MIDLIQREVKTTPYYQQNFSNDGERFVAWYLRRVLLRDDIETRDDITDGKDDKQIDAVIVDDEERRVVVIQGKFLTEKLVDKEPLLEVLGAWIRLQDLGALQKDCNERLKRKLEAVRRAIDDEYRIEFELLTTGKLTEPAQADFAAFATRLEESDDFTASLHLVETELLETRLAEAEAQELPSIEHTVVVDPAKTLVTSLAGAQTIITILPLRECLKLPGITNGRLFRKNVRQSLGGNNKVNRALRLTINGERVRDFFFYHNGVTALCDSMKLNDDKTKLAIKGLSVVNGCQSVSTINSVSERVRSSEAKDANILFRFYEIPDRAFADRISINTNSQTAVKPRDLRSNDKVMVGLKRAFETRYGCDMSGERFANSVNAHLPDDNSFVLCCYTMALAPIAKPREIISRDGDQTMPGSNVSDAARTPTHPAQPVLAAIQDPAAEWAEPLLDSPPLPGQRISHTKAARVRRFPRGDLRRRGWEAHSYVRTTI